MNEWVYPISMLPVLVLASTTYYLFCSKRALKRRDKKRAAKNPIQDMVSWKKQRRIQEAREWQEQFGRLLGPPHRCPCGWLSYGEIAVEQHRKDHAWETRNLGNLPDGYVALWRRVPEKDRVLPQQLWFTS